MSLPFELTDVRKVVAYKRDEITTDLICFDVVTEQSGGRRTWIFHEKQPEFERVVAELSELPGFMTDWRERVVLPPFASCETVVYARNCEDPIA